MIHDELTLDGSPNLNLASFVHTWMPDEANKLMMENLSKNLIDQDEYPMTRMSVHYRYLLSGSRSILLVEVIHTRCMLLEVPSLRSMLTTTHRHLHLGRPVARARRAPRYWYRDDRIV